VLAEIDRLGELEAVVPEVKPGADLVDAVRRAYPGMSETAAQQLIDARVAAQEYMAGLPTMNWAEKMSRGRGSSAQSVVMDFLKANKFERREVFDFYQLVNYWTIGSETQGGQVLSRAAASSYKRSLAKEFVPKGFQHTEILLTAKEQNLLLNVKAISEELFAKVVPKQELYRGINNGLAKQAKEALAKDGRIGVGVNALSSWSYEANLAREFAAETSDGLMIRKVAMRDDVWVFIGGSEREVIMGSRNYIVEVAREATTVVKADRLVIIELDADAEQANWLHQKKKPKAKKP
jgi:hypothetical protein